MSLEIADVGELNAILSKAYWIEAQLELASDWDAYLTAGEKYRDLLFELAHDSEMHKALVRRLCINIEGIDFAAIEAESRKKQFEFVGLMDEEIMGEVLKYDQLAHDLYEKLLKFSNRDMIAKIWRKNDPGDFYKDVQWLVKEEERHISMLRPYARKMDRIL